MHSDVWKAFSEEGERAGGARCRQMGFKGVVNSVTPPLNRLVSSSRSVPCARSRHQKKTRRPPFPLPFFQLAPGAVQGLSSSASLCSRPPSISGAVFPSRASHRPSLLKASGASAPSRMDPSFTRLGFTQQCRESRQRLKVQPTERQEVE